MNDLLRKAIEASGGLDRWKSVREMNVTVKLGGLVLELRSDFDDTPVRDLTISTEKPQVIVSKFPTDDGTRGVFLGHSVRIESDDGRVIQGRKNPRRRFYWPPWRRFQEWDDLDVLYFTGYAIWNYFLTPYLLSFDGVQTREIPPDEPGVRRLEAVFPADMPTHSRRQRFRLHSTRRVGLWASYTTSTTPSTYSPGAIAQHHASGEPPRNCRAAATAAQQARACGKVEAGLLQLAVVTPQTARFEQRPNVLAKQGRRWIRPRSRTRLGIGILAGRLRSTQAERNSDCEWQCEQTVASQCA